MGTDIPANETPQEKFDRLSLEAWTKYQAIAKRPTEIYLEAEAKLKTEMMAIVQPAFDEYNATYSALYALLERELNPIDAETEARISAELDRILTNES